MTNVIKGRMVETFHHPKTVVVIREFDEDKELVSAYSNDTLSPLYHIPAFLRKQMGVGYFPIRPSEDPNDN